jgi:hypothetical protein
VHQNLAGLVKTSPSEFLLGGSEVGMETLHPLPHTCTSARDGMKGLALLGNHPYLNYSLVVVVVVLSLLQDPIMNLHF